MAEGQEFFRTPRGNQAEFFFRDGTNDRSMIHSILEDNEYGIHDYGGGWAIDIGAHIGIWTVAMALDNPHMNIVAVEALAENALMAQRNVRLNNLEGRVKVIQRAASSSNHPQDIAYGFKGSDYLQAHRYIGGQTAPEGTEHLIQKVPGLRLTRLLRMIGSGIRIMKIDCEGCEWQFLKSPLTVEIEEIVGEYHDKQPEEVVALLPFHNVTTADVGSLGAFHAIRKS